MFIQNIPIELDLTNIVWARAQNESYALGVASGDSERVDYECIPRPQVSKAAANEARILAA